MHQAGMNNNIPSSPSIQIVQQPQQMRGRVAIAVIVGAFCLIMFLLIFGQPTGPTSLSEMAMKGQKDYIPAVYDKSKLGTPMPHFPEPEVRWTNFPSADTFTATNEFPKKLRVLI